MELRAHCETSAVLKACLVAAQYVGIGSSITTKIDGSLSTTDVVLRTSNGEVRGRTAVLRSVRCQSELMEAMKNHCLDNCLPAHRQEESLAKETVRQSGYMYAQGF